MAQCHHVLYPVSKQNQATIDPPAKISKWRVADARLYAGWVSTTKFKYINEMTIFMKFTHF